LIRQISLIIALLLVSSLTARSAEDATPLFSRHVEAVFSKLGCNAGVCHGAVQGQNGFRLTLFAANPEQDHARLLREFAGRRLNLSDPDSSLLLQKATGRVSHVGGKRTEVGSPEYQILRRWIENGAKLEPLDKSRVTQLRVMPSEQIVTQGESFRLRVEAKFSDGSTEDVTSICSFESRDLQVADAASDGAVRATGVGDTALIIRYRSEPAMATVLVPRPSKDAFPETTGNNFVDQHVLAKLKLLNIPPAPVADDATFLRRAMLDITGELPTPKEIRDFLDDKSPDKRIKKIDELLKRPGHAAVWTLKFCDILKASDYGVYADAVDEKHDAPRLQAWVRARLEENIPYDQLVDRILTATSRDGRSVEDWSTEVTALFEGYKTPRTDLDVYAKRKTLDLYWQRQKATGVAGSLQVAHSFLGLRLECAQCHRHPHDVWQQDDLLSFANFFMRVRSSGFQGDNEKRFPEVATYFKKFNDEAKSMADQVKKMKDAKGKELDEKLKKAKAGGKKDEIDAALKELDAFNKEVGDMDRKSKNLPEIARRMMQSEIQHLSDDKPGVASVTSPLGTQSSKQHRLLGESKSIDIPKTQDPRPLLMEWLRRPDNPFFAKAIVNRVWAHYFGRGIIDPPDNLSPFNPASHPELLKQLCDGFIQNKYDLRWLHRTILTSRTYQQSSQANAANAIDRSNYAYFWYRRLPAEVILDALNQATGTREELDMKYENWPTDMKAVEIPYKTRNEFVNFVLDQFGKPARNSSSQCDCERDPGVSILQVMSLANHPRVRQKIEDPKGHAARIAKEINGDDKQVEELFLLTVSRLPDDVEKQACLKYVKESGSAEKGLQGVLWSLINTREFLLQH
jgi:Protein of unknown function (DUF1549)/Protein of unknown function (DUF1553)